MTKTIDYKQLTRGATIAVTGEVEFARLLTHIDGAELEADKERKTKLGMIPVNVPYTTITVKNAQIRPLDPSGVLTVNERYVQERFYQSLGDPNGVIHYHVDNRSPFPNKFFLYNKDDSTAVPFTPEGEFAPGMKVMLIHTVLSSNKAGYNRNFVQLTQIIAMEPPRYNLGVSENALAALGITVKPGAAIENNGAIHAATIADPALADIPVEEEPPVVFSAAPAPAPAPQPAAEGPWTCSVCGASVPANMKFCGNCGQPRPVDIAAGINPWAQNPNPGGGIRFDPNGQNRDY